MTQLYPLRFQPLWRHYLWGGRRLATELNKAIPAEGPTAESWEIVDRQADQSVVLHGPLQGQTLHALLEEDPAALVGKKHSAAPRFPLLFKFLDAAQALSIQVHPNDQQAARLPGNELGKTEAWIVMAAEPGSHLFAGLPHGHDRAGSSANSSRARGTIALGASSRAWAIASFCRPA